MATKGLCREDFDSGEDFCKAADTLVAQVHPDRVVEHRNMLYDGFPQLDSFWFAEYKGAWGFLRYLFVIVYKCVCLLVPF